MAGPHWHISRFCSMLSVCARFLKHEDALADGSGTKLTSDGKFMLSNLSRANVRLCYMSANFVHIIIVWPCSCSALEYTSAG